VAFAAGILANLIAIAGIILAFLIHRHGPQMRYVLPMLFLCLVIFVASLALGSLPPELTQAQAY
jgi:hypothetical protein